MNLYMGWQKSPELYQKERAEYLRLIERKYGEVGLKKYLAFEKKQKGQCVICLRRMILVGDHKPRTRKLRGLICVWCNSILGNIERMPWVVKNIKAYLEL